MKKYILLGLIFPFLLVGIAFAERVDKVIWCHVEPNGNQQTLELPQQALEQAGHVDAQGNPLHAGDHPGPCVTPSPSPSPSVSPSPTPSPTDTPTASPSATPSPTISPTPQATTQPTSAPEVKTNPVNEKGQEVVLPKAPLSK